LAPPWSLIVAPLCFGAVSDSRMSSNWITASPEAGIATSTRSGEQIFDVQKAASQPLATPDASKRTTACGLPVTSSRYLAAALAVA
jgi:hypothetical protein